MTSISIVHYDSYCNSALALDYHDGPILGVAFRHDGTGICFRWIGENQVNICRVFLVVPIPVAEVKRIWGAISLYEEPRLPLWCPNSDGNHPVAKEWDALVASVLALLESGEEIFAVQSVDLIGVSKEMRLSKSQSAKIRAVAQANQILNLEAETMLEDLCVYIKRKQ